MPDLSSPLARPAVRIAPTLATMAELYQLSREGGPASTRFRAYVARVEHEWGLVAYNPMAGTAARECVSGLLALDAEALARAAPTAGADACGYHDPVTLALAVRSQGMWTDRLATEAQERVTGGYPAGFGLVSLWSREPVTAGDVRRESAAEAVRVMWTALHGPAVALPTVLAREGLAYALATAATSVADPYGGAPTAVDDESLRGALDVLGDTTELGEIIGVLFGDEAATTMGWTPLGVPRSAGYRWAIDRATRSVAAHGAASALRATWDRGAP